MTRYDGYRLLACPLCNTVHAKANVVSFNLMAFENWSDGRSVHSLFDNRQGLRQCSACRDFFLESEATYIGRLSSYESTRQVVHHDIDIPAFLRRDADGDSSSPTTDCHVSAAEIKSATWIEGVRNWWSKKQRTKAKASHHNRDKNSAEDTPQYPYLQSVFDSDLVSIIEKADNYSDHLILAVRKLYWMYLNDPYRDTARNLIKKGKDPHQAYDPTELQIENMELLISLINRKKENYLRTSLAELYRELGEFDLCIQILEQRNSQDMESETILTAARSGVSAPVLIRYPHQQRL